MAAFGEEMHPPDLLINLSLACIDRQRAVTASLACIAPLSHTWFFMPQRRARPAKFVHPAVAAGLRPCDHQDCLEVGTFRAPRSRNLKDYFWFCLAHVRAYNAAWDYYRGMSQDEIEFCRRADVVGWRPSWPLGRGSGAYRLDADSLRAALGAWFDEEDIPGFGGAPPARPRPPLTPEEEALAVLDLQIGVTADELKARYKALVKRHHPDANGGDKAAEERLKLINQAYTFLKTQGAKLAARE